MSKFRYLFLLILVLLVTLFTRWLLTSVEKPTDAPPTETRHDPDYFLSDFRATIYDHKGQPNYRVDASHLDHYPDDDTMELKVVRIEYDDADQQRWQATSDRGIAYKNIEVLQLDGNVEVKRLTNNPDKMLTIQAEKLRFDFIKQQASTKTQVKITGKNSNINAVGMHVDLNTGLLTLESRARGHYVP